MKVYICEPGHRCYDASILTQQQRDNAIIIEESEIPTPLQIEGKEVIEILDKENNTILHTYKDIDVVEKIIELTDKERITELEKTLASVIKLTLGGSTNG